MWIQFAFDAHWVNANSIHTQTESSVKRPTHTHAHTHTHTHTHTNHLSPQLKLLSPWWPKLLYTLEYLMHVLFHEVSSCTNDKTTSKVDTSTISMSTPPLLTDSVLGQMMSVHEPV